MVDVDLMLDTDLVIEILRGSPNAGAWLESVGDSTLGVSVFVHMEALMGAGFEARIR